MSDYVVHFAKPSDAISAYDAMLSILTSGQIEARSKFGCATNVVGLSDSQLSACFSEIPLDMLDRLVQRRSQYGIGFHQATVIPRGAGRVWYLDAETPQREAVRRLVTEAMRGGVDPGHDIWRITPFADYTAPNYHFEWEREWRVPKGLQFTPADVAFLFVPEQLHVRATSFLQSGAGGAGPAYGCPLLDPLWGDDQIQAALSNLPPIPGAQSS